MRHFLLFLLILSATYAAEVEVPNPLHLHSNWWSYFTVDTNELQKNIENTEQELTILKTSLDKERHEQLLYLIDKIELNLSLYLQEKQQVSERTATKVQYLETYSLSELLKVNLNLSKTKKANACYQEEIKRLEVLKKFHQKKLDEAAILYRNAESETVAKLLLGLEIMTERSEVGVIQAQIESAEKKMKFFETEREKLSKELEIAKKNLDLNDLNTNEVNKRLQETRNVYESAKHALLNLQEQIFRNIEGAVATGANSRLSSQKETAKKTEVAAAKAAVILIEVERLMVRLQQEPDTVTTKSLQEHLNEWNDEIENLQLQLKFWEESANDEFVRLGKNLSQVTLKDSIPEEEQNQILRNLHTALDQTIQNIQMIKLRLNDAELLMGELSNRLLQEKSLGETWWILTKQYTYTTWGTISNIGQMKLFNINEKPITLYNVIQALLALIAAIMLTYMLNHVVFFRQKLTQNLKHSTQYILSRTINYAIVTIGFFVALAYIGINFSSLVIVAGALGVGIGFGLQTIANNLISGFLILYQRNVKIGDIVEIDQNLLGKVLEISLQNSRIQTFEGIDVIVPNSLLTSKMLSNWTMMDYRRRYSIPFSVAYGTDKEKVREAGIEAAKRIACTISGDKRVPDPQVWLTKFADSALEFQLVVWVNILIPTPFSSPACAYSWELETILKEYGITIPFPQQVVYVKEFPESGKAKEGAVTQPG